MTNLQHECEQVERLQRLLATGRLTRDLTLHYLDLDAGYEAKLLDDERQTVGEYFDEHATDNRLRLITFHGFDSQFLELRRMKDGRIDLLDYGCSDTGDDLRNISVRELRKMVLRWARIMIDDCPIEERGELEEQILPQIEKI
jgi:hypothetical protein